MNPAASPRRRATAAMSAAFWSASLAAVLSACGGGGESPPPEAKGTAPGTLDLPVGEALPAFHMAAVTLDEPGMVDADGSSASASMSAHTQALDASARALDTTRLTPDAIDAAQRRSTLGIGGINESNGSNGSNGESASMAGTSSTATASAAAAAATPAVVTVYTPAQIRAAYGLPALPVPGASLTAAAAAALGAGQTIYLVDAKHNPNTLADLNTFSSRFGLPTCQALAVAPNAALPLAAAKTGTAAACNLAVVYATAAGGMTATAPAYDAGWASEISLDVQWAHAIAPLARLVLIEVVDAQSASLVGGVRLANALGSGTVSMSFGATEGSWVASVDSVFRGAGMGYVAAAGDAGAQVNWPSVSATVLAVGGTTLSYSGTSNGSANSSANGGVRSETVWSRSGGGVSAVVAQPAYQSGLAVFGSATRKLRGVADVAFNADPNSGQYVAITRPGAATPGWYSMGGTSLAAPQWAGLLAIANAQRATLGKAALGAPHAALYRSIAASPGNYASAFADIKQGSNGSCNGCTAAAGYDLASGLGTPNSSALLPLLAAN